MVDFFLTFMGALIWGDLTLISCGVMVATGEENLYIDFFACYLGIISHDYFLYYMGYHHSGSLLKFKYIQKKMDIPDNLIFKNYYINNNIFDFFKYKLKSNLTLSVPISLGIIKINQVEYIKNFFLINFIFSCTLFFLFNLISEVLLTYHLVPSIPTLTGGILSILSFLIYRLFIKIITILKILN